MKKLIILLIALSLAGLAFADVIVGTGTSTQYTPMSTMWNYYRSAALYTAADINAGDGTITNLQWYCGTANTTTGIPVKIYMKYTAAAALTADTWVNLVAGTTEVFNATIIANATGWFDFDITDFAYDGDLGNLMVLIETGSTPYASPYVGWQYTSTSPAYKFLTANADGTIPSSLSTSYSRPNIKFVGINAVVYPEPTNHATDFAAGTIGYTSIPLTWTGSTGAQLPAGYLIQAIKVGTGSYVSVTDTNPVANDAVWTDGNAAINVAHVVGANTYTFTGLTPNTAYEFKIWPYTNSGALINFKVDDPIPTVNASTLDATIYAEDLPYPQNFDSVTAPALPDGWLSLDNNADGDMWKTFTSYPSANSTPNCASIYTDYNSSNDDYLVTPRVELTGNQRMKFWTKAQSTGEPDELSILLSSTTPEAANFTLTAMASTAINFTTYTEYTVDLSAYTGFHYIAFARKNAPADGWYLSIDDVLIENIPTAGVLQVTPDPVECGNSYVGFDKSVQVSLTNTGVAAFIVSTIALEDYTNFDLADLPTLPVTINPGDPAVTFTVVFNPTVAGALTTNLLINDTRLPSSIVVNGTGVDPLVGEICENPYLATLPLVDYAGTTAGYANDYTSAMFTGLGSTSYVGGLDWVAKITIPSAGMLDISLANPSGDATYYYPGMFLVNTIPSLASPAAVLAQAYASTAPINITDAIVAAGDYYLIVDNWPSPASINFVLNISFEAVTSAPNPATLVSPLDDAINVPLTQTLNWSSGGGYVEGYRLSLGTVDPYAVIVNDEDLEMATTYDPVLAYSTEYWWTVTPYNYLGDATPITEWSFTTAADPTVIIPPDYLTNFETWPATNWSQMNYLYGGTPVTGGSWGQDDWLNVTSPVDKAAKINIYYTHNSWLVTPPIQVPGGDYVLEFDLALMVWSSLSTPVTAGNQADDRLLLVMSDNADMSSPTTLMEWNNTGSSNVFDDISPTGETISYPLAGITGTKHFAWYAESITDTAGDNDLMVNNVMIRIPPTAPEAPLLVYPGTDATDLPKAGFDLSWQNNPLGMEPDYFVVYMWTDEQEIGNGPTWETADASVTSLDPTDQEWQGAPFTFAYDERWNWTVSAVVGTTEVIADSRWFVIQSDPTIVALPHEEYFDDVIAPALPYGWTAVVDATSTSAYVNTYSSTTYSVSAPNVARMYNYSDTAANLMLITPEIDVPINTIKTKFYARGSTAGQVLLVGTVNPADSTFTEMGSIVTTTTQTQYEVSFDSYAGTDTYIAFKHGLGSTYRTIYIDNVQLLELLPNDLAATAVSNPGIMTAGTAYDFTVDVYNEGTATQSAYTVKLMSVDARTELATLDVTTPLDPGASAQHILSWTPATGGVYEVYGKVVLTGDQNATNDDSPTTELYVLDNTMTVIPVGDDATTTSSTMLPVDMYYRNSVTEELYFTDEMHLQSGNITALVYKNTFLNERPDKAIKIWMAHTTVTDLSGGWLPTLDYTLVFDGTVDFPSGVNYVVIPLDTPFAYTGGTLATRFYRVFDSGALSSSDKFYYTTHPAHTVRSRYLRSDSTTYDPLAPSAAGTTLGYFPNTTFVVQNAVMQAGAVLNGYVYEAGGTTPVAGATVTIEDVRYSTTTDENGYYEFRFWEAHTVDAAVAKFGYYGATQASISLPLGTPVTQDFYLTPLPQASVSGTVTANDYPAGLEGATVSLFGYDDYEVQTGTGGAFSIADVYGNSAGEIYSVTVEKDGYTSYIGTLTVYESAVTGLSYNLVEYLWTPYNLVASHEGADARLNWDPAGLPDYQFYDFEADNGGFTHVDNPTPGWEWGTSSYSGAHSGTKVWGTVLEGNYANSAVYDLISPPSNLIPAGAFLTFWHFYRFEFYTTPSYYDGGIVQISTDGGTNWTTITPVGGYPCTSTSDLGSVQMYGGEQLTWTQANFDLSAYTNQTVMFKWKMLSESSVSREGWFVDDVFIGIPIAKTALQRFGASNDDRVFLNYDVYRFLAADEGTPGNWNLLDGAVADTTYLDTGFAALGEGSYKWAVKANYSGALESEAIISNALGIFITPPDVENGTIGATGNNVTIAWPAEPGASYYTVYGSNDPYAPDPWAILGYSATPSFTFDAGATAYKFFKITASDGEMPASKGVWPQLNK